MLELTSEPREKLSHWNDGSSERQSALREWEGPAGPPVRLLIAGVVILSLGFSHGPISAPIGGDI